MRRIYLQSEVPREERRNAEDWGWVEMGLDGDEFYCRDCTNSDPIMLTDAQVWKEPRRAAHKWKKTGRGGLMESRLLCCYCAGARATGDDDLAVAEGVFEDLVELAGVE